MLPPAKSWKAISTAHAARPRFRSYGAFLASCPQSLTPHLSDFSGEPFRPHSDRQVHAQRIPRSPERFLDATTGWLDLRFTAAYVLKGPDAARGGLRSLPWRLEQKSFSFDLSSAVDAAWRNNAGTSKLTAFQASIYEIPLRKGRSTRSSAWALATLPGRRRCISQPGSFPATGRRNCD